MGTIIFVVFYFFFQSVFGIAVNANIPSALSNIQDNQQVQSLLNQPAAINVLKEQATNVQLANVQATNVQVSNVQATSSSVSTMVPKSTPQTTPGQAFANPSNSDPQTTATLSTQSVIWITLSCGVGLLLLSVFVLRKKFKKQSEDPNDLEEGGSYSGEALKGETPKQIEAFEAETQRQSYVPLGENKVMPVPDIDTPPKAVIQNTIKQNYGLEMHKRAKLFAARKLLISTKVRDLSPSMANNFSPNMAPNSRSRRSFYHESVDADTTVLPDIPPSSPSTPPFNNFHALVTSPILKKNNFKGAKKISPSKLKAAALAARVSDSSGHSDECAV